MAVVVVAFNVVVVVLPVASTGVVRRVDVDCVDLAAVRVGEHFEGMIVLSVDHRVEWLVTTTLDPAGFHEPREDLVVELRHDHEIIEWCIWRCR